MENILLIIAFFVVPLKHNIVKQTYYCAMDDYTQIIKSEGGQWGEYPIYGNNFIVKVKASTTTIAVIEQEEDFYRIGENEAQATLPIGSKTWEQLNQEVQ